jgi:hypothetical protein
MKLKEHVMLSEHAPARIAIAPDKELAKHVGWTQDGRQFFLTTPCVSGMRGTTGNRFLALYVFDADGIIVSAEIEDLGPYEPGREASVHQRLADHLASLGNTTSARITVRPFLVERFGTSFGLAVRAPESEDEGWTVEAQPGGYMAFTEPWDSGEYVT